MKKNRINIINCFGKYNFFTSCKSPSLSLTNRQAIHQRTDSVQDGWNRGEREQY
jgi:hypothetical protein